MTTFNWTIATLEYDLQPSDMDGAVIVAHWRVNAEETTGEGDDAVTYTASAYGTCGFSPDPSAPVMYPTLILPKTELFLGGCTTQ
jgi:hypothetical protein